MVKKSLTVIACTACMLALSSEAMSQRPDGPPREGGRPGAGREAGRGSGGRPGEDGPRGEGGHGGGDRGPEMMMRMMPVVRVLDKDGDGIISSAEIDSAVASLKTLDKNGDGQLDASELRPDFPGGRGPGGPGGFGGPGGRPGGGDAGGMMDRLMAQDKDGNGKLSGDEIPERMRPMVDRADTNKDGELDKSELENFFRNMPRDGGGRGGFGGREGGGRPGGDRPRRPEAE